jgi:phosphate starvation-inducible protein PhoH
MLSVEHIRGMSIENALVIVEESQNLTKDELEAILTRIGDGCQLVLTGDHKQNDLKGKSGLLETIQMIDSTLDHEPDYLDDADMQCLAQNIGIVNFTPEDVVRSGLCRAFVKMYYYN